MREKEEKKEMIHSHESESEISRVIDRFRHFALSTFPQIPLADFSLLDFIESPSRRAFHLTYSFLTNPITFEPREKNVHLSLAILKPSHGIKQKCVRLNENSGEENKTNLFLKSRTDLLSIHY